jgi:hypothetical protein
MYHGARFGLWAHQETGYRPCLQTAPARGGAALTEFAREARVHRPAVQGARFDYRHAKNRQEKLAPTLLTVTHHGAMRCCTHAGGVPWQA